MAVYAHLFETMSLNLLALRVFDTLFYSPVRHCRTASTRRKAVTVRENRCVILCHQYMTQSASRSRQRQKASFTVPEVTGAMPIGTQTVGVAPGRCPLLILRAFPAHARKGVRMCADPHGKCAAASAGSLRLKRRGGAKTASPAGRAAASAQAAARRQARRPWQRGRPPAGRGRCRRAGPTRAG